ncbi:unnamed protein product [Lasius platythorax]|uniref:CCHC-type domain-containing protein n=1 Tax=Lasius platythorax TaxID=488582 RepID=A0AAV2MW01_9HYME
MQFCYRCGRLGTTVKDCPICQDAWKAQGLYIPGRDHEGPEPPHCTGPPPPCGRATHPGSKTRRSTRLYTSSCPELALVDPTILSWST